MASWADGEMVASGAQNGSPPGRGPGGRCGSCVLSSDGDYPRSWRASCGWELACERMLVLAWARIWARVSLAVSAAKSVSRIALSAALAFSKATPSWFTVELM